MALVLSYYHVEPLLKARQAGASTASTSPDLGLTKVQVEVGPEGVTFPGGQRLDWESLAEIHANQTACFAIQDGSPQAIRGYSESSGMVYSLLPTPSAPTMLVSGLPMHRIKGTDPFLDTMSKIKAAAPLRGRVLDTATGLGYTAIEAAKTARRVLTIEIDPTAQEIARQNPWSQALFDNPKITQVIEDAFDKIGEFEAESFSTIIHDPPMFSLAGDLYSLEFYQQAFRVLKNSGKMFHYIGDPESKSGARVTTGVMRRLQEAGFKRVVRAPRAFGVVAYKA